MRKYIFIAGGLLFFCAFAWAQENKNVNPYTDRMQQLLNKSNASAADQFNRNYPQPQAPTINNRSGVPIKTLPAAPATPAPSAPTPWTQQQPQQNQTTSSTTSAPVDANKNTTNTPPNIYLPANPNNNNQKNSSDSSINIFR